MKTLPSKFKCRWCAWERPAWYTEPGEGRVNGGDKLVEHVEVDHPAEYDAMQADLNVLYGEKDPES